MKKPILAILISITLLYTCGCGRVTPPKILPPSANNPSTQNSIDNSLGNKNEEYNTIAVYTGENITEESSRRVPFLAVIENMKVARPQSGLSSADIVFETLAEGGIPRFMALFQSQSVKKIGPIRSDREYFNEISEMLNLPFAHCGGSQAALDDIENKNLMSLNEMKNGEYYWRDKSRKMPHNLYTSSAKITKLINKKDYAKIPKFNLSFDNSYWENVENKASEITLKMSGYYTTGYNYDNVTGMYIKTMNNEKVKDLNNGKFLSAKNIIIQETKIVPILGDEKKRVDIKLSGSGNGYLFSNGGFKKIVWEKAGDGNQIEISDENGQEVKLSKGNTWWEIVDASSKLTIN